MKTVRKIAVVIIGLFSLMLWSGIVRNVTLGERSLGFLTEPIKSFSEVISNTKKAYTYFFVAPDYYIKTKESDLVEINNLSYNLFGIYSFRRGNAFKIELKNFKDGSIKHSWNIDIDMLSEHYKVNPNDRLYPATLMSNFDLIVSCNERQGLLRLDSISKPIWFNKDFIYHHAMNFDIDGNIWIPGVEHNEGVISPNLISIEGSQHYYRDDLIVKVDAKSGKTIYSKSLTAIFIENDLEYLINKSAYINDPFHLNDIQPVLETTDYFTSGDLFLSFRSLSMIIQYRPETNKVVKVIQGPFLFQHDIDVISQNSIAILNNNTLATQLKGHDIEFKPTNQTVERKINHSNVLIYNFEEDTYQALYEEHFKQNNIFTEAEGLYELLPNGDLFFEEQGSGILWVINSKGIVLKTTLKSDIEGYHYLPNWTTIYTNLNL